MLRMLVCTLLACSACGEVTATTPDVLPGRVVACNGNQPVSVLENGNFDSLDPPWAQDPPSPSLLCGQPRITPDSGAVAGCLGGGADNSMTTLSRDVPLPLGARRATLTGRLCIATQETEPLDNDVLTFELMDRAAVIGTLGRRSNQQGRADCQFTSFAFDAPLTSDPVTATLRIRSTLDIGRPTSFYVDTLTLTVSCTP